MSFRTAVRAAILPLALAVAGAPAVTAGSSQDVVVASKAFATLAAPGAPTIALRLARVVKDDRCPARVLCAWAGPTIIEVEARSGAAAARLTLSSKGGVAAHFQGWRFELRFVEPQPQEPEDFQKLKPLEAYRATLRASRL